MKWVIFSKACEQTTAGTSAGHGYPIAVIWDEIACLGFGPRAGMFSP